MPGPADEDRRIYLNQLADAAVAGEPGAKARLFQEVLPDVERAAFGTVRRTGLSFDEAQDLAQEALTRGWRAFSRYRGASESGGIVAWLATIATNYALDLQKSSYRRRSSGLTLDDLLDDGDTQPTPEDRLLEREVTAELEAQLALLSPLQREALIAQAFDGKSIAEIAKAMDSEEGAIKSLGYRGRRALERSIDPESPLYRVPRVEGQPRRRGFRTGLEPAAPPELADDLAAAGIWLTSAI